VEEIRERIGAESLGYLSLAGLRQTAAKELKRGTCDACFSNEYPVEVDSSEEVPQLTLFRAVKEEDTAF
jgi:amidophosphoribosyltransferase